MTNIHKEDLCESESPQTLNERKWCSVCDKEVSAEQITKAYKLNTKTIVPLSEDEIASLPVKSTKEIEVVQFFTENLDVRYHSEHLYYIGPDGKPKAYVLLLTAMMKAGVKALARFKKSLYVIEPFNGVLTMREIVYADNLRGPEEIKLGIDQAMKKVAIGEKEQSAVGQLIAGMVEELDPAAYTNTYTEALEKLVEAKLEGKVVTVAATTEAKTTADDGLADAIMAYLNKGKEPVAEVKTVIVPAGEFVPLVVGQSPEPVEEQEFVELPW
jgi:DNA end-binding protein Ku